MAPYLPRADRKGEFRTYYPFALIVAQRVLKWPWASFLLFGLKFITAEALLPQNYNSFQSNLIFAGKNLDDACSGRYARYIQFSGLRISFYHLSTYVKQTNTADLSAGDTNPVICGIGI